MITLQPELLTAAAFAPYGDVVESSQQQVAAMNAESFERFDDLCSVEAHDGHVAISIARCRTITTLPHTFDMIERHPHGSQSFVPNPVPHDGGCSARRGASCRCRPARIRVQWPTGYQLPPRNLAHATDRF